MKKAYLAMLAAALPAAALAQSAIDAQQISQPDFRGTARFMSMGGAFTALGGDLSTLNQNPAGIGIYRSNEVGVTLDINFQNTSTSPSYRPNFPSTNSQTKAYCNNFGYIGSTRLDGPMRTFNWGVSYNRAQSFDRVYRGYVANTATSLSNYVAAFSSGTPAADLEFASGYNPYFDSDCDWLTILSYNSYLINPTASGTAYNGLYQSGTIGDALFNVRETGHVDEYDISFGGNVENVVYWGLSIGLTDLNYTRTIYYDESLDNALVINNAGNGTTPGAAGFGLNSRKYISGNGWNLKFGLIFKPINEFRIGLAVHTPTWYSLNQGYDGSIDFAYTPNGQTQTRTGYEYTEDANFNWHYRAPWKLMAGIAGVIGGRGIISVDYQFDGYGNQSIATPIVYQGFIDGYEANDYLNSDLRSYFKAANTVRVGLEYRVTPQFSVRAGVNKRFSYVKAEAANGQIQVLTSGTDPSYSFDQDVLHITAGIGYRYKAWYIDAAYVYKNRQSTYHAFTNFDGFAAPQSKITDHNSSIVLSTGIKF